MNEKEEPYAGLRSLGNVPETEISQALLTLEKGKGKYLCFFSKGNQMSLRAANEELRKLRRKVHWSEISEPDSHAAAIVSNNALD